MWIDKMLSHDTKSLHFAWPRNYEMPSWCYSPFSHSPGFDYLHCTCFGEFGCNWMFALVWCSVGITEILFTTQTSLLSVYKNRWNVFEVDKKMWEFMDVTFFCLHCDLFSVGGLLGVSFLVHGWLLLGLSLSTFLVQAPIQNQSQLPIQNIFINMSKQEDEVGWRYNL